MSISITKMLILSFLIFLLLPKPVILAETNATIAAEIKDDPVNPGSPYYVFKRIKETFTLNFLTFGEKNKAAYSEELLDTRLRELVHAVKNNNTGYLENVANRYTNQAGIIIEKYLNIDPNIKIQSQKNISILEYLRDNYPANSPYWLMIQYAVDTTKRIAGS